MVERGRKGKIIFIAFILFALSQNNKQKCFMDARAMVKLFKIADAGRIYFSEKCFYFRFFFRSFENAQRRVAIDGHISF